MVPAEWNSLSAATKSSAAIITTDTTFKTHLKTEVFSAVYDMV